MRGLSIHPQFYLEFVETTVSRSIITAREYEKKRLLVKLLTTEHCSPEALGNCIYIKATNYFCQISPLPLPLPLPSPLGVLAALSFYQYSSQLALFVHSTKGSRRIDYRDFSLCQNILFPRSKRSNEDPMQTLTL